MVQLHGKIGNGELQTRLPVSGFWRDARIPRVEFPSETSAFVCHPLHTRLRCMCVRASACNHPSFVSRRCLT